VLKKSHALVLGVATAGLIGFGAPMAGAATMSGPSSLANVSNNQIPIQICGNDVYGNVIGGQVPVEGDALVASLLSPSAVTKAKAVNNRGCAVYEVQQNSHDNEGSTLVNVAGNQIPVQVCGNDIFINGIGGQVPLYGLAGAISGLSPASYTKAVAVNNRGCESMNDQQNGHRDGKDGMDGSWQGTKGSHGTHGTCPCKSKNGMKAGAVTSNVAGTPANGDDVNSNVAGHPVNGGGITSGLSGITSGLQGTKGLQGATKGLQVSK
jgi:hypothetical protein